ncbi:MAG: GNAT family N-acetyltransferase [Oscillospiraceae bacterium]|nr:GNAT family N-acetyltransferase [Oscillospiraceae bacterium]
MTLCVKKFEELTTEELYRILKLRVNVFVVEQCCPYPELDDCDQKAIHVWLEDEDGMEAYLRIIDRGIKSEWVTIGRVIAVKRRAGLGTSVLQAGIRAAREYFQAESVYLEAQTYARAFYEKQGFRVISDEFLEDGIAHVKMLLELK